MADNSTHRFGSGSGFGSLIRSSDLFTGAAVWSWKALLVLEPEGMLKKGVLFLFTITMGSSGHGFRGRGILVWETPRVLSKCGLTLWLLLVLAAKTSGGFLLVDRFDYADGKVTEGRGSPWVAHSATGVNPITVAGGRMQLIGGFSEDISAGLAGAPYLPTDGTVLYARFEVTFMELPTAIGAYFAHFRAGFGFNCRIWASTTNAAPGSFRLGVGNGSGATATTGQLDQDLMVGVPYTVVTRLSTSNGLSCLWVNPLSEASPGLCASDVDGSFGATTYAFRQSPGGGTCWIDELRIATSFAEVISPNKPPFISSLNGQSLAPDTFTAPLAFLVTDVETPSTALLVTASSSNPGLVSATNVVISGSGSNRTVVVTPHPGSQGVTTLTLGVTDSDGATTVSTFKVTVGRPYVSCFEPLIVSMSSSTGPLPFRIGRAGISPDTLFLTAASSDPSIVAPSNIVFGGSGEFRTVTITPMPGQVGVTTMTITVSDGTLSSSQSFPLTVRPIQGMILNERFDYPDGTNLTLGGTPWRNLSGTIGQTVVQGGQIWITQTNNENLAVDLPFAASAGVVLFASFKIRFTQLPGQFTRYFASFLGNTNAGSGRCFLFAVTRATPPGTVRLGISHQSNDPNLIPLHPQPLVLGTDYTVVVRYDSDVGNCALWVDPVSDLSPFVLARYAGFGTAKPLSFALFQGPGSFANGSLGTFTLDDLRIGTSFFDVIPDRVAAFPGISLTRRCDHGLEIAWPAALANFGLMRASSVNGPWSASSDQGAIIGDHKVVVLYEYPTNALFRLQAP